MTRTRTRTTATALVAVGCTAVLLSGCAAQQQAAAGASQPSSSQSGQARGGQQRMPGAFGLIAEISGKTVQIQGTSGQTAVTYDDSTTFTAQVKGAAADLTVGACVTVRSANTDASGTVTASTISVSEPVSGACQSLGGMTGGAPGAMPSGDPVGQGTPGAMPTGADQMTPPAGDPGGGQPSGLPSGGSGGRPVSGTIASVGAGTITVTVTSPTGASASPTATTVSFGSDVTITKSEASTATAMKVGGCAWANGQTDSTGTIAATSIRLSDAVNGACTMG